MKKLRLAGIFWCAISVVALPPSARAQSSDASDPIAPIYDATKETKIQGTIQQVETVKTGLGGTHLTLRTQNGAVDVHLGAGPAADAKRLGLSLGQSVEITGMMATTGGRNVFLARTLATDSHTITLRNERGMPVRALMPQKSQAAPAPPKGGF